jgi:hypothetical protein
MVFRRLSVDVNKVQFTSKFQEKEFFRSYVIFIIEVTERFCILLSSEKRNETPRLRCMKKVEVEIILFIVFIFQGVFDEVNFLKCNFQILKKK